MTEKHEGENILEGGGGPKIITEVKLRQHYKS